MSNNFVYVYLTLTIIYSLKLNIALATTNTSATDNVVSNVTEYRIDLMHEMIKRILAKANADSNFLIAPQEALKLYLHLHGTEEEIVADEASIAASDDDADATHVENTDFNTPIGDNTVRNEVKSDSVDNMKEFEEFFHITLSPILVSNTLYANVYTAKRFTRKLKNFQFVLRDENEEDNGNTSSNSHNGSEGSRNGKNIDINIPAVARNTNNNGQHNTIHNHNKNNENRNELISDVHINSRWVHNFQKRDTHKRQFHMPQTHTHAYLNHMRKDDIFPYANLEELNASALELSLQRWQLKMLIILPHAKDGLKQLLQRLSENVTLLHELCGMKLDTEPQSVPATTISNHRRHLESTLVRVFLPKFRFTQRTSLGDVFQQLLNVTSNVDLHWPSPWQVIQEVHFAVSEDGIGELEPSMVLFWNAFSSLRTKPLMFCVDHPFMFIVYNRQGIQLLGHLAQLHE